MTHESSIPFDNWLFETRRGNADCLARLLDAYRNYLHLLARMQISQMLQIRVSPSDLARTRFWLLDEHSAVFVAAQSPKCWRGCERFSRSD